MAPPKKTSRELQAEQTRVHILQTALRLFAERGISATSTRRIAKEAGVSEGLIFHHFPKKRDLLLGIRRGRVGFSDRIVAVMSESADAPVEVVIRGVASSFVAMLGSGSAEARLFQILLGESRTDPELGAMFKERSGQVVGAIAGYLQARVDAGELRADLCCEAAAMNLLGSFVWFFVYSRHESEEAWAEAATAYGEHIVDLWLRGARVSP